MLYQVYNKLTLDLMEFESHYSHDCSVLRSGAIVSYLLRARTRSGGIGAIRRERIDKETTAVGLNEVVLAMKTNARHEPYIFINGSSGEGAE